MSKKTIKFDINLL